ncbi:hypothetical protein Tco_1124377 [Tanacetum coccineum]|uniref:Uncharacterized protein n=1 Tax=Tanacetum coccineum TaxID=301880 RepID=A0ABQ5J5Z5_9ASTR
MSDSEDSTVTYTAVSSPFEDGSDIGSPGVDGPPIMPEDPYAYIVAALSVHHRLATLLAPEEPQLLPAEVLPMPADASPLQIHHDLFLSYDRGGGAGGDDEVPEEDPAVLLCDRDDD